MARLEIVVTAESGLVPGWKNTLMMLTPGKERDSMCSMPLPKVKKRSNRPVISFSTCSGGMPLKNVATTTTGILIAGKRSTGIRAMLVMPKTQTIRQRTMTK